VVFSRLPAGAAGIFFSGSPKEVANARHPRCWNLKAPWLGANGVGEWLRRRSQISNGVKPRDAK